MDDRVRNCLLTVIALGAIIWVYRHITHRIELKHYGRQAEAVVVDVQPAGRQMHVKIRYQIDKRDYYSTFRTDEPKKYPLREKLNIHYHPDYPHRPLLNIDPDGLEKDLNRIFVFAVAFAIFIAIRLMVKATAPHTG